MSRTFTWLHLSDLHVGQKGQSWLWPNVKSIFLQDLAALLKESGTVDAVIFSGDLTQKGSQEEYEVLTKVLEEIWTVLKQAGSDPILFPIPGNHDLARPGENPVGEVLKDWWGKPKTRELFWSKDKDYYPHVCATFSNYMVWIESLKGHPTIRLGSATEGILPGDSSITLQLDDIKVGLIGLNSAFLQLTAGDYEGQLDLSVHQILAVTEDAPSEWCLQHDVNFLVTHHPTSWLKDQAHFEEHIYHPNRFTAHLFGHLHDIDDVTVSRGGAGRKSVQAASLFGLEYLIESDQTLRAHGYSIGQIQIDDEGASWKLWPRKSHVGKDGSRKFIPDHDLPLVRGEEFLVERLTVRDKSIASKTVTPIPTLVPDLASPAADRILPIRQVLDSTAYRVIIQPPHVAIRGLEQQACCFTLKSKRICWIVSDWGLGTDGFLSSVLGRLELVSAPVFKIDLGSYDSRDTFFSEFSTRTRCSFTEYCKMLGANGTSILILDEAPVHTGVPGTENDAMKLAELVTDFCIDVFVFIISRTIPKLIGSPYIHLVPLDEADTRAYLIAHTEVGPELKTKSAVSEIYRRTEGVPGKIDRSIKQLRVVSLSDLASEMISDAKNTGLSKESIPLSLVQAVDRLRLSKNDHSKRTWVLLKILSALPSGEALQRIKYLASRTTLRSEHAEELLELNLIGVRVASTFMTSAGETKEKFKILYTPRQVRDHVISLVPSSEIEDLTGRAVSLYFGDNWRSGAAKLRTFGDDPKSDDRSVLMNASVLALRLLAFAVAAEKEHGIKQAITICKAYCVHGFSHKHFRDMVTVCKDILGLLPIATSPHEKGFFELTLANAMRMTGDGQEAVEIYERLQLLSWSNTEKISVLLNHAFCLQQTRPEEAILMAKEIIRTDRHSNHALQAHTLILEIEAEENSHFKLAKIQRDARKRGANVVANNIVLSLANSSPDSVELELSLIEVRDTADKEQDYYNSARAAIQLARLYSNREVALPPEVLGNLIKAYQYLFGQRLASLFDSAHALLWDEFESIRDIPNLLTLFKHSSFNWRLDNKEEKEKSYASRLITMERKLLKVDILQSNADTAYFLSRSGKQLLLK
ncbi:metallophosphoesterase [Pseudomonas sp. LB3P38]|uniref:metallophosphoesterase n=1 Tax=Pseudomonas lyxosi TaxID=3398358 RepID=UPI0039EE85F2